MEETLLQVKGITKSFPGVVALSDVDFTLKAGEVHVLVGENGAGKSTLAKCILGVYKPDSGQMYLNNEPVSFSDPKDALDHGIAAVYQELTMVPYLNAPQNIFLNREPEYKFTKIINYKKMEQEAKSFLDILGCQDIDLKTPVLKFDVATQQMIEIAKALSFNPKIIIFDEATASLSERETELLFLQINKLRQKGLGIIYVSHRMQEYHKIGDRITILRDGKFIRTIQNGELSDDALVNLMVGRDISQVYVRTPNVYEGECLRVEELSDKKGRVHSCSLTLNKGEVVGIAGLVGSGRTELARMIFGIDKPRSGKIVLNGTDITGIPPNLAVKMGLGLLPEDRKRFGLALKASLAWNIVAVGLKIFFPSGFISERKNIEIANKYIKLLNIHPPDVRRIVRQLSGGNQQKVVISKWLAAKSTVMIFDEPTRGIDVGAKMEIYSLIDNLATQGNSILMISSELSEVVGMSDRIYIMKDGYIIDHYKRGEKTEEEIGKLMVLGKLC